MMATTPDATLPPILVVNLDRDPGRLQHMKAQCDRLGLAFTRFAAVLGDDVPAALRRNFFDDGGRKISPLKRGEVGCYASHLAIYQRMLDGDYGGAVLVLEDDIEIADDFASVVAAALAALPPDWDIVRLSNMPKRAYVPLAALPNGRDLVRYSKIPNSTGAYLVSRSGARKLVGPRLRERAIDQDLGYAFAWNLDTYGIVPAPVKPDVLTSTIDALEAGRLDKGIKKSARRAARWRPLHTWQRTMFNARVLGPGRWLGCALANALDRVRRRIGLPSILARAARVLAASRR